MITIAHRLSTAEAADQVFVFDAGELVEEGTHAELVATRAAVRGAVQSWLGNVRESTPATYGWSRDVTTRSTAPRQAAERAVPDRGRAIRCPGSTAPVTVERDRWGMPRIDAASLDDLWFAQGIVTAGERLFQLDLFLRAATGRLSEVFGELTFEDDGFVRTIGLHRAGERHAAGTWTEPTTRCTRGSAPASAPGSTRCPRPRSSTSCSICSRPCPTTRAAWASAFAYLAWGLSNNWDTELLRAELDARLGRAVTDTLLPVAAAGGGVGSNDWVVAGRHTASGARSWRTTRTCW